MIMLNLNYTYTYPLCLAKETKPKNRTENYLDFSRFKKLQIFIEILYYTSPVNSLTNCLKQFCCRSVTVKRWIWIIHIIWDEMKWLHKLDIIINYITGSRISCHLKTQGVLVIILQIRLKWSSGSFFLTFTSYKFDFTKLNQQFLCFHHAITIIPTTEYYNLNPPRVLIGYFVHY